MILVVLFEKKLKYVESKKKKKHLYFEEIQAAIKEKFLLFCTLWLEMGPLNMLYCSTVLFSKCFIILN